MIPKNPEEIEINSSQQGLLEIAEHFARQKFIGRGPADRAGDVKDQTCSGEDNDLAREGSK